LKLSLAAVIEPNAAQWKKIASGLAKAGMKVSAARELAQLGREQVVVLGPTVKSHAQVAKKVRAARNEVVVLSAQARGFKAAFADGVLPLPVSPNDLRVRLPELASLRSAPARDEPSMRPGDGILDPLTSFYTFTHFKEVLFIEVKRARRYGFPLSVALLSFDSLATEIDAELRSQLMGGLALAIRRSLRDTDYPVQYSAERVLLLMPHTDLQGALIVSRRICERVAKATLAHGEELLRPTISIGVAAGSAGREYAFADLTRQANESLELALGRGGNRVEFHDVAAKTPEA
jgi:diguanylate cyclase (GGDEF)-like protein